MKISVLILTHNEELNIKKTILNVINWADEIIVIDSFSDDNTIKILEEFNIKIYYNKFINFKEQRLFALNKTSISNEWVLFLDADEWLTDSLKVEIKKTIKFTEFDGFLIKRRFYFMGSWIKYGGYYPSWNLRLFKRKLASINRDINEHIEIDGIVSKLKNDMVDENQKKFGQWITKHNKYSDLESVQLTRKDTDQLAVFFGNPIERKRWIREKIWNKMMPPLIRPFIYFIYRYFFRLGFLDGRAGFIYHFNHALVYRLFIDIKFLELKKHETDNTRP